MDIVSFKEEAEKLARSGSRYQESGEGAPSAYWHGVYDTGLCLSILNVYLDEDSGGHVEVTSSPIISDIPLFSSPYSSLPPLDGVFNLGSEMIGGFLEENDWPRDEPLNDNFPSSISIEYEGVWQDNSTISARN